MTAISIFCLSRDLNAHMEVLISLVSGCIKHV